MAEICFEVQWTPHNLLQQKSARNFVLWARSPLYNKNMINLRVVTFTIHIGPHHTITSLIILRDQHVPRCSTPLIPKCAQITAIYLKILIVTTVKSWNQRPVK